jgi:hypothetical protein
MTTAAVSPDELRPQEDTELTYSRTVDRDLVHRDSLGEVFLTDLKATGLTGRGTDPGRDSGGDSGGDPGSGPIRAPHYTAAAQLPRSHAYYGDHLLRPTAYDPVLLLEASRQAALAGAHEFYGVPGDHKFILTHLRIALTRPEHVVVGATPCRLAMRVAVTAHRHREGRTTGLDYEIGLYAQDREIGSAAVGLRFKSPEDYLRLRLDNRNGKPLPSSATLRDRFEYAAVDPYLVGRANADNVVLSGCEAAGGGSRALLRVPATHPSMFDHPQDHLPGMVLAEAARQLALLSALESRGLSPSRTPVTALSVIFNRFGELDRPAELQCEQPCPPQTGVTWTQGGPLGQDDPAGGLLVRGSCTQDGESLCVFTVTLGSAGAQS